MWIDEFIVLKYNLCSWIKFNWKVSINSGRGGVKLLFCYYIYICIVIDNIIYGSDYFRYVCM